MFSMRLLYMRLPLAAMLAYSVLTVRFLSSAVTGPATSMPPWNKAFDADRGQGGGLGAGFRQEAAVDAVALIALGEIAGSPVLDLSLRNLREKGGYWGPVYVLTDRPECLSSSMLFRVEVLRLEEDADGRAGQQRARLTKCRVLELLPETANSILYLDADILVSGNLGSFWDEMRRSWSSADEGAALALFPDSLSYTWGECAGCDAFHTGVIGMVRGRSEGCLHEWCERLEQADGTDQSALQSVVEEGGACEEIAVMSPRNHMRFMKDVFVVFGVVGEATFCHFTSIFRPHFLSNLHRWRYERSLGVALEDLQPDPENPTC
jgi:hypothetical protein